MGRLVVHTIFFKRLLMLVKFTDSLSFTGMLGVAGIWCGRDLFTGSIFAGAGVLNQEVTGFLSRHLWAPVGATVLGFPFSSLYFSMTPTHLTRLGVLLRTPGGLQRALFCGGLNVALVTSCTTIPYSLARVGATTPVTR